MIADPFFLCLFTLAATHKSRVLVTENVENVDNVENIENVEYDSSELFEPFKSVKMSKNLIQTLHKSQKFEYPEDTLEKTRHQSRRGGQGR